MSKLFVLAPTQASCLNALDEDISSNDLLVLLNRIIDGDIECVALCDAEDLNSQHNYVSSLQWVKRNKPIIAAESGYLYFENLPDHVAETLYDETYWHFVNNRYVLMRFIMKDPNSLHQIREALLLLLE